MYLGDGKELSFPVIGSILVKSISNNTRKDYFLDFSTQVSNQYINQIHYFSNLWGKSEVEVNRFFLRLSDEILANCQHTGTFHFPNVGKFELSNDKVYFHSANYLENRLNNYFSFEDQSSEGSLEISSVKELKVSKLDKVEEEQVYISRPKFFKQIAAALLLLVIGFTALFVYNTFSKDYRFPANFNLDDTGYLESDFNKSPLIKDFPVEDKRPDKETVKPELSIIPKDSKINKKVKAENKADSSVQLEEETCIYILGSYRNEQNVLSLEQKIRDLAEEPIRYNTGSLTRVGVSVSCSSVKIIQKLSNISPDMWMLQE